MFPLFNGTSEYVLSPPIAVSEEQQITCQEEGHPSDWLGRVLQRRTYTAQNGVRVPGTETPWITFDDNCRAPYPCASGTVSWTVSSTCSGTIGQIASGSSGSVNNSAAKRNGSATFSCFDGTRTYVSGTCVYVPSNCGGGNVSWSASGNSCTGSIAATTHGKSRAVSDSSGTTGNATMTCNDGTYYASGASCKAEPPAEPPGSCPAVAKATSSSPGSNVRLNYGGTLPIDNACATVEVGPLASAANGTVVTLSRRLISNNTCACHEHGNRRAVCNNGTWQWQNNASRLSYFNACV